MTKTIGIDCAHPLTAAKAKAISAAGYTFVARYLVPPQYAWKRLTRAEAELISEAGMHVVSVFEASANRAIGGAAAGQPDGVAALAEAQAIGQPVGSVIYFAVDYDAPAKDFDVIERYLRAAGAAIGKYTLGVYGSYAVIEAMAARIPGIYCWQTYAWSRGKVSDWTNIHQHKNDVTLAGHTVDLNESFGREGWWSTIPAKPPVTPPTPTPKKLTDYPDVEAGRWSEASIAQMAELKVMSGVPGGLFAPKQSMSREEAAVFGSNLIRAVQQLVDKK